MRTLKIPAVPEYDVRIVLPNGVEWLMQYRNYNGDLDTGEGGSVDLLLDRKRPVYNWAGGGMGAARATRKSEPHVRKADQLCFVF